MGKYILLVIISIVLTNILYIFMGVREPEEKIEISYRVIAQNGTIGCLSETYFLQMEGFARTGNLSQVQKLLDKEICFFFSRGTKLYAKEGICANINDIAPFKPNDFLMLQPYLRCSSVELETASNAK